MKKTVKPSPIAVIFFGTVAAICLIGFIAELVKDGYLSVANVLLLLLIGGVFVYYLLKYLSQEKIYFDENTFTVGDKTYGFDEITNVTVDNEQVLRNISTLRIRVFVNEEEVCHFAKDDRGGKEFIAVLKKQGVSVSIDV